MSRGGAGDPPDYGGHRDPEPASLRLLEPRVFRLTGRSQRPLPFPGWRKRPARPGQKGQTVTGAGATGAAGARLRALLLIPVMLLVLAPAVLVGLAMRSQSPCGPAIRPPHTAAALSPPKICPPKSQLLVHQRLPSR